MKTIMQPPPPPTPPPGPPPTTTPIAPSSTHAVSSGPNPVPTEQEGEASITDTSSQQAQTLCYNVQLVDGFIYAVLRLEPLAMTLSNPTTTDVFQTYLYTDIKSWQGNSHHFNLQLMDETKIDLNTREGADIAKNVLIATRRLGGKQTQEKTAIGHAVENTFKYSRKLSVSLRRLSTRTPSVLLVPQIDQTLHHEHAHIMPLYPITRLVLLGLHLIVVFILWVLLMDQGYNTQCYLVYTIVLFVFWSLSYLIGAAIELDPLQKGQGGQGLNIVRFIVLLPALVCVVCVVLLSAFGGVRGGGSCKCTRSNKWKWYTDPCCLCYVVFGTIASGAMASVLSIGLVVPLLLVTVEHATPCSSSDVANCCLRPYILGIVGSFVYLIVWPILYIWTTHQHEHWTSRQKKLVLAVGCVFFLASALISILGQ